jgi:hypothetical protein
MFAITDVPQAQAKKMIFDLTKGQKKVRTTGKWQKIFFVVLARDKTHVKEKIIELERLKVPYTIICGEKMDHPNIVYRPPKGKYNAINHSLSVIPRDTDIIIFNDVDTKIDKYQPLLDLLKDMTIGISYAPELIIEGPQTTLFKILNPIRSKIPLAASGELMAIRKNLVEKMLPLKPCKAEDTYMMFKVLEMGYKVVQYDKCPILTERTKEPSKEEQYKRKTVTGIYQAISFTNPPAVTKLAYLLLPIVSPLFLALGPNGYYTIKGIILGLLDYLREDKTGIWSQEYL